MRKVQENQISLELNRTHQAFVYVDINLLGDNTNTIKENSEILLEVNRNIGLKINAQKTNYMTMSCHPNSEPENKDS
jgi:hypothetical protein